MFLTTKIVKFYAVPLNTVLFNDSNTSLVFKRTNFKKNLNRRIGHTRRFFFFFDNPIKNKHFPIRYYLTKVDYSRQIYPR